MGSLLQGDSTFGSGRLKTAHYPTFDKGRILKGLELDAMIRVLIAIATVAYGFWYGLFAKEFKAVHPWTGRTKYRYKPKPYLRVMVVAVSLMILVAGVAEILRLSKSN